MVVMGLPKQRAMLVEFHGRSDVFPTAESSGIVVLELVARSVQFLQFVVRQLVNGGAIVCVLAV
jgi:hypothetical protein